MKTKFYTFTQNNSGGSFKIDKEQGINEIVIIEAKNAEEANKRAEDIGLYFDGCEKDLDCSCCGDRWYETDEYYGKDEPCYYTKPIKECKKEIFADGCYVHYLDGTIKYHEFDD